MFRKVRRKSNFAQVGTEYTFCELGCVYARRPSRKQNCNTLELNRPQRDRPTTCVIAQQYSSATFVSLRFHSCKDKFDTRFKNVIIFFMFC